MSPTDRIEKTIHIAAPIERVWRAISNAQEFGEWFGLKAEAPFEAGATIGALITDPPGYEDQPFELVIERVEPPKHLAFRWHPYAEPGTDLSTEPMTLVEFNLTAAGDETDLQIIESGFDKLSPERKAEAWRMNEHGWSIQVKNVKQHVEKRG